MNPRETLDNRGLRVALINSFRWRGDDGTDARYADRTRWLRDPAVLSSLGRGLGELVDGEPPTVVVAPQSSGYLLGPLVATHFHAGFVPASKEAERLADSDSWLTTRTPLDYQGRNLELGFRQFLIGPEDRVLIVDDWADTGGQLLALKSVVAQTGAKLTGICVIVDALKQNSVRRELDLKSLLHLRDL